MRKNGYYNGRNSTFYSCCSNSDDFNTCPSSDSSSSNSTSTTSNSDNGNRNRSGSRCCGRRFSNDLSNSDKKVKRLINCLEDQLEATNDSIDELNNIFNSLEDAIYDDRCCLSNRVKNILKSIQRDICDLSDDVQDISQDLNCLDQAL